MVNWKLTATTIYCDIFAEEVTVLVLKDGATKCTGCAKYTIIGSRAKGKSTKCPGPNCPKVTAYKDKLFAEEKSANG